ncbi:MAG: TrkH family potassium uptake protein, partial [Bilophila sp.]
MGVLLACIGASLLLPLWVSFWYADGAFMGVLASLAIVTGGGLALAYSNRSEKLLNLTVRDGLAVVGVCWIAASFAGGLPFVLTSHASITNAVFEAASGFTTTGATIFGDVEALPKSLLMWRSLTHWLGGLGIIVLSLVILPLLGVGGMQLYKAEVTGPTPDKLTPRMHDTASMLWKVYCLMTAVQTVLLFFAGMDWFDALNHTFATVATGGFSTRNASIAAFPSPVIQWIIIVFMFLAGINFALHYHFLCGRGSIYYKDKECVSYTALLGGGSAIIAVTLVVAGLFSANTLAELEHVVRASVFQLVSLCTTTGFVSENYSSWPPLVLCIFLFFMFMGGCAGSTSGGIKTMRFAILMRMAYQEIFRLLHPHSVRHIKLGGRTIFPEVISGVIGFLLLYMIVLTLCTALLTTQDMDLLSAFTASLTCLSNVGPGLGSVGPVDNFDHLTTLAKWLLTLCMLLGRLEIYAIIVLF